MKELYREMKKASKESKRCALATIIRQAGPAPRGLGARCLIGDDGLLAGTIGGGRLEAETINKVPSVLRSNCPERLHFVLKGKDVEQTDMLCGGEAEVFIEPVVYDIHLPIFERVAHIQKKGGKAAVATILNPELWKQEQVPKVLWTKEGQKLGGDLALFQQHESQLHEAMKWVMDSPRPQKLILDAGVEIFLEPIVSNPVLYIFGGGHVSRQIVPIAALVGFTVVVVDDREEFTRPEDLPGATEVYQLPFDGVMDKLPVNGDSYLVIVTRGHVYDKEVLAQALKTNAKYIGMIGSKKKREIIYEKLLKQGFSRDDLARVHSPIGLDIGAETPEEIAVSIVAELIKVRAGV